MTREADTRLSQVTVRTSHERPAAVAAALQPDNTAEMATRVEAGQVVTSIERKTTGGLRSTLDDYLVNLSVADRLTVETHDSTP